MKHINKTFSVVVISSVFVGVNTIDSAHYPLDENELKPIVLQAASSASSTVAITVKNTITGQIYNIPPNESSRSGYIMSSTEF
ncbi:MAG: hypothetical protein ISR48_07345 [Alphaproteobacteria bacterium]|nr:hypothetical protein [Alphaproteobacteria bacterium]